MPNWDEIKRMLRQAVTPQEKEETARALDEHIRRDHSGYLGRKITFAQGGKNVISLGNLPDEMRNPEVYDKVKKTLGR